MSSDSDSSSSAKISDGKVPSGAGTGFTKSAYGVRAPKFRFFFGKCNIFVNDTEASTELLKRATEIITNKESSSEMDDALAKKLADQEWNLETSHEAELVQSLVISLLPDTTQAPYQSLKRNQNKKWSSFVEVPFEPFTVANVPRSPTPEPEFVFGYSKTAFNTSQFKVSRFLETNSGEDYGMPDGNTIFPFLVLECKTQATGLSFCSH